MHHLLKDMAKQIEANSPKPSQCFIEIGPKRFVKNTVFRDEQRIDIREYSGLAGFPTKKGISLKLYNWVDLVSWADSIEAKVIELVRGLTVKQKWHLGSNIFASIDSEFNNCIDIRQWFLPEGENDVMPTKKGIALPISQWHNLRDTIGPMEKFIPELAQLEPCNLSDDHKNEIGFLRCNHCSPNSSLEEY